MSDEQQTPDPLIVVALRRLGRQHEPNSEAIWARIDPARQGSPAQPKRALTSMSARPGPGGAGQHGRRPQPPSRSRTRGVLVASLAAAGVMGVLVVSQVLTRPTDGSAVATTASPRPVVRTTESGPPTGTPTPSPTGTASAIGDATATSPDRPNRTASTPSAGRPTKSATPSEPVPNRPRGTEGVPDGEWPLGAATVTAVPEGARSAVLSTGPLEDWLVVGILDEGRLVRAVRPLLSSNFTIKPPAGSRHEPGPFSVSWVDGTPEKNRTESGNADWLLGPVGGSWTISTNRVEVPRRLTVHAGGAAGGLRVEASTPGTGRAGWVWTTNPAGSDPFVIGVDLPGGVGPVTITITPLDSGRLGVSSATLTRI